MLIVAVPRSKVIRREIMAFQFPGLTVFDAFRAVDRYVTSLTGIDVYGCSPLTITVEQLDAWVRNNVNPNWLERLRGDFRVALYTVTDEDVAKDA